ncbi:MAG: hypothetical protein CMH30_00325 [Micavibrio sp.]|nr:hypothetical protein [Micavibrio sp.]|tara:strand:+ start:78 stop:551 length:474 start_codon:yes stop_codon:yes gene_type:complete
METIIKDISDAFNANRDRILNGEYGLLLGRCFSTFTVLEEEQGKKVITLMYNDGIAETMPKQAQHVDVFILDAGASLGEHFHEHATAEITVLFGRGTAHVGPFRLKIGPASEVLFQSSVIHDVRNKSPETMVFISLQDNPIIQADGKIDYCPVLRAV